MPERLICQHVGFVSRGLKNNSVRCMAELGVTLNMKKVFFAVYLTAICAVATAAEPPLPRVELEFNLMGARDWQGKRFTEIIPVDTIRRVVRFRESGFSTRSKVAADQGDYDALLAHLVDSAETASDWGLSADEATLAKLVILSKDGELFRVEVVGKLGAMRTPSAILLHGKGHGARINVKDFKYPEVKE